MADSNLMSTTVATQVGLGGTFNTLLDILKYGVPAFGGLVVLVLILIWCCRFCSSLFKDPEEDKYEQDELMEDKNEWDNISVLGARINFLESNNKDKRRLSNTSDNYFINVDEGLPDDSFNAKLLEHNSFVSVDSGRGTGTSTPKKTWKRTKSMTESIEMLDLADVHYSSKSSSLSGSHTSLNKDRSGSVDSAMDEAIQLTPSKLSQEKLNHVIDMERKWVPPAYESVYSVRSYSDVDTMSLSSYKIALNEGALMTPFLSRRDFTFDKMEVGDTNSLKRINAYNAETIKQPVVVRQSSQTVPVFSEAPMTPFNDRKEISSLYNISDADDTDTESAQKSVRVMAEIYAQGRPIFSTQDDKPNKPVKLQSKQKIASTDSTQQESSINHASGSGDIPVQRKSKPTEKAKRTHSFQSNGSIALVHDKSEDYIVSLPMSNEERLKATRQYQRQHSTNTEYSTNTEESYYLDTPRRSYFASDSESEKEEKEEPYFPKNLKKKKVPTATLR